MRLQKHKQREYARNLIYCRQSIKNSLRGGCWFCHNQTKKQLRFLRKNYPEYWELMLKWDKDSPVTFRTDGTTIHDLESMFAFEDSQISIFNEVEI